MATRKIYPQTKGERELSLALQQLTVVVNELKTKFNIAVTELAEIKADFNGTLTKLDSDAGVTDTNYSSTRAIAAPDPTAVSGVADTVKN